MEEYWRRSLDVEFQGGPCTAGPAVRSCGSSMSFVFGLSRQLRRKVEKPQRRSAGVAVQFPHVAAQAFATQWKNIFCNVQLIENADQIRKGRAGNSRWHFSSGADSQAILAGGIRIDAGPLARNDSSRARRQVRPSDGQLESGGNAPDQLESANTREPLARTLF